MNTRLWDGGVSALGGPRGLQNRYAMRICAGQKANVSQNDLCVDSVWTLGVRRST